ncbi:hypothetical protein ACJX0J_022036, partial [Zea mays]
CSWIDRTRYSQARFYFQQLIVCTPINNYFYNIFFLMTTCKLNGNRDLQGFQIIIMLSASEVNGNFTGIVHTV